MAFTETFGGTTIYPSDVSYRAISLSADQTLSWPLETATNGNVVAQIMDVTPSAGGFKIIMPAANEASPGETALFFNAGSYNFTVADSLGSTIVTITPGLAYQVYLTTNATAAGTWRTTQFGAGTSSATAGSLVGYGIKAINTTLNQSMAVTSLSVNYTAGAADRSSAFLWTGGAGTITLPAASTVGNDWFFHLRNGGTGAIAVTPTGGEFINGSASVAFNPGDSSIIVCDGSGYFTIGFGQAPEFLFDYVSIDLTGQTSPYTLAGSNLNRIAYQFSGTLTTNMQVIVPATIQQYWVGNFTTGGSYTLTVKTSGGTGVTVARDSRSILYCNGTDVVTADTGGISIPILVSQGGTGATNASSARTNLGATSVGNAVFIAVDEAAARNAIIAAKSGANSDITSLSGLTTPLSVAQGGTGAATLTSNGLVYGSGTSAVGVTAAGTTGQVLVGNTGSAPSWAALTGIGVTSFSAGSTGLTPSTGTTGAITLAGTLVAANGGTGQSSYTIGDLLYASGATALSKLADVATGNALISGGVGVAPAWGKIGLTTHVSGTLDVGNGGTGATTLTSNGVLYGNGTSAIAATAAGTTGQVLVGNTGGAPSWAAATTVGVTSLSFGSTGLTPSTATQGAISVAGTLVVSNGGTGATTLTGYVKGSGTSALTASATIPASDISSGAALTKADDTNVTLTLGGSPTTALLAATSITAGWTGQLAVSRGGTGASTLTSNGVLLGNGTSAISATAVGLTGQVLVGNTGYAPTWAALSSNAVTSLSGGTTGLTPSSATTGAITLAGTLNVANGGTGTATAFTAGSVVFAGASGVYSQNNSQLFWNNSTNRLGVGNASPGATLDVTGNIRLSAASPNIELNNGGPMVYSPAANTLAFAKGGGPGSPVETMRIASDGAVGIGNSTPNATLHIQGIAGGNGRMTQSSTGGTSQTNLNIIASSSGGGADQWFSYGVTSGYNYFIQSGVGSGSSGLVITSTNNVLINESSPSSASLQHNFEVNGDIMSTGSAAGLFWANRSAAPSSGADWYGWYTTSGTIYLYNPASGNIASINASTGAYTALSDRNKKKDITPSAVGLAEILQLQPMEYRMETDDADAPKQLGFIAQEVRDHIPQAYVEEQNTDAGGNESTYIGLNDRPIIAALVNAVQEQQSQISALEARLAQLEGK